MKILHTSDWHLGHILYNHDRMDEQRDMISQITNIVSEEKPDVFLLCGDVYHTSQPSSAVQCMFTEAMVKIHDANPSMTIIVTAGNHDSASKHDIFQTPWRALNVYTVGNLEKESPENHIIEVKGKGFVVAIPYCHERNIPDDYFQSLLDSVKERNTDGLPVIMMAHTTVRGCDFSGHENASEYVVGGIDSLDINQLGEGYDYLALGHIHNAQFVHSGNHKVRYCGTPLPVSFDETQIHSVSIVEIDKHGDNASVSTKEINNPRPLVTLPIEGVATWDEAKQLLTDFPSDIPAYIRLNVEIVDFIPADAYAEAVSLTECKQCVLCHINPKRRETNKSEAKTMTVQEFQTEDPITIATRYAEDRGISFDQEMVDMFREIVKMVETDERNA